MSSVFGRLELCELALGWTTRFQDESGDCGELNADGAVVLAFPANGLINQLGKNPQAASTAARCFEIALHTADVSAALVRAVAAGVMHAWSGVPGQVLKPSKILCLRRSAGV